MGSDVGMGILDRLRHRSNDGSTRTELAQYGMRAMLESQGKNLTEEMQKGEDITNYNMIHDDPIEQLLENDGNPAFLGLRVRMSPLIRQSYIPPFESDTYKLMMKCDMILMECDMEEDEFEGGGDFLIESYLLNILIALDDAKTGHKAQLIKTRQTITGMRFGLQKEAKGEG